MARMEELKAQVHILLDEVSSEDALFRFKRELEEHLSIPMASEEEEARFAKGLDQAEQGKTISLDEFRSQSKAKIQELIVKAK